MVDKKLVKTVEGSMKYVLLNVVTQWVSLICNIVIIFSIGNILNEAFINRTVESLNKNLLILLGLIIIRFICAIVASRYSYLASEKVKLTLREKIYHKLLKLGPSYNEKISTSEIVQVAVEGVDQLEIYFGRYLPQLFYSLLAPLTLFIVLSFVNFPSAIILFICVPLIPISIILVQKFAKKLLSKYWGQYTTLGDSFLENIEGLTTLKIYEADEAKNNEMNEEAELFRKVTMKVLFMQLNSISVMDLIAFGGAALGVIVASLQFTKGNINFAQTFAIILLSAEFFIPLRLLGSFFHIAMNGMAASDKIFKLLDLEEVSYGDEMITDPIENISLSGLNFSYIEEKQILFDIKMNFKRGFNAIVGESGSGKSTIAKLLSLQNTGYSGNITINNAQLNTISLDDLVSKIMLVPHDAYLFKGTIKDNLLMANKNASEKEMLEVISKVSLKAFIDEQDGLDTIIMENGSNLSGGQRQRIALARALMSDAEVFIFDEATSNIDVESEQLIMDVIKSLSKEHVVIVISHRLANTVEADYLYVIDHGRLVEEGSHQKLLAHKAKYYDLYTTQMQYEQFSGGIR